MNKKQKVWIDTDIGDDIDDAFALLLAMDMGMEIVGVSTVYQDTEKRARLTKKLLKLFGNGYENVPVYVGYGKMLSEDNRPGDIFSQYTSDLDSSEYAPDVEEPSETIDRMIECCEKYKEELTILAIGPFTNLAKVIEKSPDALKKAGKVVLMGGAYYKQYADWNVSCDPLAAKTLFDGLPNMYCLGADVTHRLQLAQSDEEKILSYAGNSRAVEYVVELYRMWKKERGGIVSVLHDPLIVYYACDERVCTCAKAPIVVMTDGYARGMTLNVSAFGRANMSPIYREFDFEHKQFVAADVDKSLLMQRFMQCFDR